MNDEAPAKPSQQGDRSQRDRLRAVTLDPNSIGHGSPEQEHERHAAIWDILERNSFQVNGQDLGPYALELAMVEKRLALVVRQAPEDQPGPGEVVAAHYLSLTPFRRVIRDYELVCNSYFEAVRSASPQQIEAIDMGRRGLHDEAAGLLQERLAGKLTVDFDTARRLFTLIFALHWKG
ncbi:UPF0262 family protein [Camelimonas abortus]|uniref:UPF0262 protein ACFOEX_06010 n=1 Tax=Camelimonas abortus TaxID=1017184 RepID=A0ABV7LFG2_9HYPH